MQKTEPEFHKKGWGYELWIANTPEYCGKVLHFDTGRRGSMHFHLKKHETWYVAKGHFRVEMINGQSAELSSVELTEGEVMVIPQGLPHRIVCLEEGNIFEISTTHDENDSYRISKGDSQSGGRV